MTISSVSSGLPIVSTKYKQLIPEKEEVFSRFARNLFSTLQKKSIVMMQADIDRMFLETGEEIQYIFQPFSHETESNWKSSERHKELSREIAKRKENAKNSENSKWDMLKVELLTAWFAFTLEEVLQFSYHETLEQLVESELVFYNKKYIHLKEIVITEESGRVCVSTKKAWKTDLLENTIDSGTYDIRYIPNITKAELWTKYLDIIKRCWVSDCYTVNDATMTIRSEWGFIEKIREQINTKDKEYLNHFFYKVHNFQTLKWVSASDAKAIIYLELKKSQIEKNNKTWQDNMLYFKTEPKESMEQYFEKIENKDLWRLKCTPEVQLISKVIRNPEYPEELKNYIQNIYRHNLFGITLSWKKDRWRKTGVQPPFFQIIADSINEEINWAYKLLQDTSIFIQNSRENGNHNEQSMIWDYDPENINQNMIYSILKEAINTGKKNGFNRLFERITKDSSVEVRWIQ